MSTEETTLRGMLSFLDIACCAKLFRRLGYHSVSRELSDSVAGALVERWKTCAWMKERVAEMRKGEEEYENNMRRLGLRVEKRTDEQIMFSLIRQNLPSEDKFSYGSWLIDSIVRPMTDDDRDAVTRNYRISPENDTTVYWIGGRYA